MPLEYDNVDGSWGSQSEGWPSTPYTAGKLLLCTKAHVVPYGSYVVVGAKPIHGPGEAFAGYDYRNAVIRCETIELRNKLEQVHQDIFITGRAALMNPYQNGESSLAMTDYA